MCIGVALFGCHEEPLHGLLVVDGCAESGGVEHAEVVLCDGIAGFRAWKIFLDGFGILHLILGGEFFSLLSLLFAAGQIEGDVVGGGLFYDERW